MEELIGKELISIEEEFHKKREAPMKTILLTEKGSVFLAEYRRMREFTDAFGL